MTDFKHFFGVPPSDQNALDLFAGEWSSSPPASRPDLKAGATPLFDDPRMQWAHAMCRCPKPTASAWRKW
jgi:hypothetical protein